MHDKPTTAEAESGGLRRPRLGRALLLAGLPAYLIPAVSAWANAQIIPDEDVSQRLAAASFTTIAIPSAVAALLVTLWCHRLIRPAVSSRKATIRAMVIAASACSLVAFAASMVLIANGWREMSILQYTATSAAVGGALTARAWVRSGARPHRPRPEQGSLVPRPVDRDRRQVAGPGVTR